MPTGGIRVPNFCVLAVISCYDDYTQLPMNCAGDHLLRSVIPTTYLKGVGTAHNGLSLIYNQATHPDDYFDTTKPIPSQPTQFFHGTTFWYYLTNYQDTATGQGAVVNYDLAYNNTHGTPATPSDNRLDPLYCDTHTDLREPLPERMMPATTPTVRSTPRVRCSPSRAAPRSSRAMEDHDPAMGATGQYL